MRTCRACLQKEADEYYSIFKRVNQTTLDDMFQLLTGLAVVRGDGLPDCVCQECSDFIVMCNNFRKKCLKSDTQLRALLPTDKSEVLLQPQLDGINERKCYEESLPTDANGQTQGELDEENSWTDETEIFLEEPVMDNGTSMTESTTNHEFDFEMYEVVEVVEPGEIEALDDYEIIQQDAKDAQQDGKEFTTPQQPVNEMKETTRPFVECCSCTGLQFASSAELKQHSANVHEKERIFNNLRPYECNVCYKRFISHATLVKHQAAPYREKKHSCAICDASFCSRSALQGHINSAHTRERKYVCEVCQKGFYTNSTLVSHRQVHGEKRHQCTICSKKFLRHSDLLSHQLAHSEERPYGCEKCALRFKTRKHLRDHQTVHTGERLIKCRKCGKGFATYSDRRVHELRHENIHPFKCPHCDKTYGRNYKLQVHIRRVHTKERPFECAICSECFYQHWEMLAHRRVEHGIIEIGSEG